METLKAGRPAIEFIKFCYRANRFPLLEAYHGIGKSELMKQAATELGIGYITRDVSLMEPPDLVGLPKMNGATTKYLPPDSLPKNGKGILTFEELNRSEKYMQGPCLELLTSRRLNDYVLPLGWLPAACINPADTKENYDVRDLDPALFSRFVRARLVADCEEWLAWARGNGIHPAVIEYVKNDSTVFDQPHSNPRSWKYVSDLIWAAEQEPTAPAILRVGIVGLVGAERGAAFLRIMKRSERPLSADAILGSYGQVGQQVRGWVKNGNLDMVTATLHELKIHLQPQQDFEAVKADRERWNCLARFLYDLPGDLLKDAKKYFAECKYVFPKCPKK